MKFIAVFFPSRIVLICGLKIPIIASLNRSFRILTNKIGKLKKHALVVKFHIFKYDAKETNSHKYKSVRDAQFTIQFWTHAIQRKRRSKSFSSDQTSDINVIKFCDFLAPFFTSFCVCTDILGEYFYSVYFSFVSFKFFECKYIS